MQHTFDLDRGNGRPFNGREQDPAQRIPDGRAEAALKGLGVELPVRRTQRLEVANQSFRFLKTFGHILLPK